MAVTSFWMLLRKKSLYDQILIKENEFLYVFLPALPIGALDLEIKLKKQDL